jgi:magnesium chelatase subunit H
LGIPEFRHHYRDDDDNFIFWTNRFASVLDEEQRKRIRYYHRITRQPIISSIDVKNKLKKMNKDAMAAFGWIQRSRTSRSFCLCAIRIIFLFLLSIYFRVQGFSVSSKFIRHSTIHVLFASTASREVIDSVAIVDVNIREPNPGLPGPKPSPSNEDIHIVLVAGFESFNRELYQNAISSSSQSNIQLTVFADSELRIMKSSVNATNSNDDNNPWIINPKFAAAMRNADVFIGSLVFDYDDVVAVQQVLEKMPKSSPKFIFESATELMSYNQVGSFSMMSSDGATKPAGPPPVVKAILSKFSSGKEEDKLSGYLQLLKIGPDILKFVPGETAQDVRTWMSVYRFWNQGGLQNIQSMFQLISQQYQRQDPAAAPAPPLPELVVTPDIGLVHPLVWKYQIPNVKPNVYFESSPAAYLRWRLSSSTKEYAKQYQFVMAPDSAPRVAVLLFRKHVITEQKYIPDLLTIMEEQGIIPIPIFINGVEAHTIVRDLLTSSEEIDQVQRGIYMRDTTYQPGKAVTVDAIVNTIGFPLVGGPAGSMEAGRNVMVASQLLSAMNVPYIVASPLLLQTIPQWRSNGVLGLQSVVLYSLPELDGAVDTVVLGGLVGDKIALIPERVRKLVSRINGWVRLRRTPRPERKIAICLYGFPPNVGAVGTAALLNVPRSLETLLSKMNEQGYDTGSWTTDSDANGESLVAALAILCENPAVMAGADRMDALLQNRIDRAIKGDETVAKTLARPGAGLGGAKVRAKNVTPEELEKMVGKYMWKRIRRFWPERGARGGQPGVSANGNYIVAGLQVGNVWIFVQPLLGVEGDPMRLLFERDLTPHPQYVATYSLLRQPEALGGFGSQAIVHMGYVCLYCIQMHSFNYHSFLMYLCFVMLSLSCQYAWDC